MSASRLPCEVHYKPWGRPVESLGWLESLIGDDRATGQRVGELWFGSASRMDPVLQRSESRKGDAEELLLKVLTTSEPLSVQVHPDDDYARLLRLPCGKHEAWVVLDAEVNASIGLGLRRPMSASQLRQAALDGTLPDCLHWQPVRPGDVIDVPPGTIHAIGSGLTLLEVQQPVDATFRLFDFARGRELHLDDGFAVSHLHPYRKALTRLDDPREQVVICEAGPFSMESWRWEGSRLANVAEAEAVWFVPLAGRCAIDGVDAPPLSAWRLQGQTLVELSRNATGIAAYVRMGLRHQRASAGLVSPVSLAS